MTLSAKLKELRTARGLTQETVADYLDISSQTVSKWERGLLSPDVKVLPRLAVLYKTSIDSMFEMESCWDEEHNKNFKDKLCKGFVGKRQILRRGRDSRTRLYLLILYCQTIFPPQLS